MKTILKNNVIYEKILKKMILKLVFILKDFLIYYINNTNIKY